MQFNRKGFEYRCGKCKITQHIRTLQIDGYETRGNKFLGRPGKYRRVKLTIYVRDENELDEDEDTYDDRYDYQFSSVKAEAYPDEEEEDDYNKLPGPPNGW